MNILALFYHWIQRQRGIDRIDKEDNRASRDAMMCVAVIAINVCVRGQSCGAAGGLYGLWTVRACFLAECWQGRWEDVLEGMVLHVSRGMSDSREGNGRNAGEGQPVANVP